MAAGSGKHQSSSKAFSKAESPAPWAQDGLPSAIVSPDSGKSPRLRGGDGLMDGFPSLRAPYRCSACPWPAQRGFPGRAARGAALQPRSGAAGGSPGPPQLPRSTGPGPSRGASPVWFARVGAALVYEKGSGVSPCPQDILHYAVDFKCSKI